MGGCTYRRITVLTGAGISAESGIETFRAAGGLWNKIDPYEVCSSEAYATNPCKVNDFFNERRAHMQKALPNAGHIALARLEREVVASGGTFTLVTQNIDELHEKAGSSNIIHIHGKVGMGFCSDCGEESAVAGDIEMDEVCVACGAVGTLRPLIVFFGEMPYDFAAAESAAASCDLFLSVGTSGTVYPAADLVAYAKHSGALTLSTNMEAHASALFDAHMQGSASICIPQLVEKILSGEAL